MFNRMRAKPRVVDRAGSTANDCLLGTTSLIGDDVYDAAGRFLGEIEEILIDARTGCVRHMVLALGGFLGIGRKRLAVPWRAFSPDADYRRCIVDVALMKLMALPVPRGDPWLREQAKSVIPPERRSTFLKPRRPGEGRGNQQAAV